SAKFRSWLAEIARNCARNWLRRQRVDTVPIDEVDADTLRISESPSSMLIRDEQIESIRLALETLPEKDRKIALAYYLEDASYEELIRAHGLSYKAISFRLSRAKRTLTNRLQHLRTEVVVPPATTAKDEKSGALTGMNIKPMRQLLDNRGWLVAFLPDGKYLAGLNSDNSLIEWDIENGQKIRVVERVTGHGETVSLFRGRTLKVSSEGTYSVVSSSFDSAGKEIVTLWNGETTESFGNETTVVAAAVPSDGKFLASGGWDRLITLWNLESKKPIRELSGHTGEIHVLAFSPDGRRLISGGAYKWVYLEGEDGSTLRRNGACAIRSDGDGSMHFYAADESQTDNTVKVWEVESGENIATLELQQKATAIAFSPDGNRVASASGKQVIVWCTKTWKAIKTLDTVEIESLAFSPDGARLAVGGTGAEPVIQICSVDTGRHLAELSGHTNRVESVAFSPDGCLLASGGSDNAIYLWEVELRE
ncbi:MAG: sigma-70 family RNA polymerase sigma factor, partial [Candidatus Poribacteria bacterium]|nr:sigma-70 family RNA polymerase sigma factor [Candidatus Poribacteria bacterium]